MPLQSALEARLAKLYTPDATILDEFRGKDLTFITDPAGHVVTLFIGKRREDGSIAGERYVRRIQFEPDGVTIRKSHWELKGKVGRA